MIGNPTNNAGQVGLLSSSIICAQNSSATQGTAVESFPTLVDVTFNRNSND